MIGRESDCVNPGDRVANLKRGLTLGKYAPLHCGHQLVIETGMSEMDEMLVIIYNAPDTTTSLLPFVQDGYMNCTLQ